MKSNINNINTSLNINKEKIESKSIKSIKSRVANIAEYLEEELSMKDFKELILKSIIEVDDIKNVPEFVLSETDWENIYNISKKRYKKWEWNYGKTSAYNKKNYHKFNSGLLEDRKRTR